MIRSLFVFIVLWCMAGPLGARESDAWIRINQLGYLPGDIKEAVLIAREEIAVDSFSLIEVKTGRVVYKGTLNGGQVREVPAEKWGMAVAYRLDFSRFTQEGG
ncbi:MAG: cellulase N-terminal Ig-like domain-containing protein, partial [Bacteroidales bacterium]|nr:cellulase N-terminal Ig-like domain-containing protein [Bacteroidales bacterium]